MLHRMAQATTVTQHRITLNVLKCSKQWNEFEVIGIVPVSLGKMI